MSKAGRLLCSSFPVCIFDPPFTTRRRLPQICLTCLEQEGFEMGIRSSHMCVQHPVQSLTQSQCLDPPPSNNQSAASLWGSFLPLGSEIKRGFAHTLTLGFGSLWPITTVHSYTHSYMEMHHSSRERKMELSTVYLPLDMTENIGCSSHVPGTFVTLCYRRGCD